MLKQNQKISKSVKKCHKSVWTPFFVDEKKFKSCKRLHCDYYI